MVNTSTKKKSVKKSVKKAATKKAAVKKAATKKTAVKKTVTKKAAVKKASTKKAAVNKSIKTISYQDRYHKIAEAAYLLAEKQNFSSGNELRHWLEAEMLIDDWIAKEKIKIF
jgi:hypothetical protein